MRYINWPVVAMVPMIIAGCGGGAAAPAGNATAYSALTPVIGHQRVYTTTSATIGTETSTGSYTDTVIAVYADGSYNISETSSGGGTTTISLNPSGQLLSTSAGIDAGCGYVPHGPGPSLPVSIGQNWTNSYTPACQNIDLGSSVEAGSVTDVEPVTVPAGTFSALILESVVTTTWKSQSGTVNETAIETVKTWLDIKTMMMVKSMASYQYSGVVAPGIVQLVSSETVLASQN